MNYAIILSGGIGSRFWPLSTELKPKQFLKICSQKPMIEQTIHRISDVFRKENIYIATNKIYSREIKKCTANLDIPTKNLFFEPEAKNTFIPIAFLSQKVGLKDTDAVIVVLPCDHIIKQKQRFLSTLNKAIKVATKGNIVTLGIPPKRLETGYGYIKVKSKLKTQNSKLKVYKVERFIEKPNLSRVKNFIRDKRFYWNSGIFVFRANVMLDEIRKIMPDIYKVILRMQSLKNKDFLRLWHKLPSISIDYAIMERTKNMALIPADFGWLDVGDWRTIDEIIKQDKDGNISLGNHIDLGSKNTTVWSTERIVATLGLNNIVIVDTKDALLVCSKDKTQEIKKLVRQISG